MYDLHGTELQAQRLGVVPLPLAVADNSCLPLAVAVIVVCPVWLLVMVVCRIIRLLLIHYNVMYEFDE